MRRALLLLPLLLLSGCTIVPISYAGPCSGVTNSRGCQEDPYLVRWHSERHHAKRRESEDHPLTRACRPARSVFIAGPAVAQH